MAKSPFALSLSKGNPDEALRHFDKPSPNGG